MLTVIACCLLVFCTDTTYKAKAASKKDSAKSELTDEEQSRLDARYELGDDGIWHLKNIPDMDAMFKSIKENLTFLAKLNAAEKEGSLIKILQLSVQRMAKQSGSLIKEEQNKSAVCMFVGDVMCLKGQQYSAGVKGGYDFSPSYSYVAKVFKTADFVCGNLETLLSESNPITKDKVTAANGSPQCNGPVVLLKALRKSGFDMFVTANNHTCDWGPTGIKETKTHLDEYGFPNVGTHYNTKNQKKAGERFSIIDVNGINIAVLSYSHLINQRGYLSSSEMKTMVHCFDRDTVKADIEDARNKGADIVAVYCHWGIENTESLNSVQKDDSQFLADAGADLIIGSHPHCLQRCTYLTSKSGKKVLCMFSMGNFCSSMAREINSDTLILRVVISRGKGENGSGFEVTDASYIPCKVTTKDGHSWVVVPTNKKLNGGYSSSVLDGAAKRIAKIIDGVIPEYKG